jgi:hypothetical protein
MRRGEEARMRGCGDAGMRGSGVLEVMAYQVEEARMRGSGVLEVMAYQVEEARMRGGADAGYSK